MTVSACLWLGLFPLLPAVLQQLPFDFELPWFDAPYVQKYGTFSTLTRDKWIIMFYLAAATVICFLADLVFRRISKPRLLPLLCGAGLLLFTALSCFFSPYPGSPWWIGTGRREGLATQLCYFGVFFLFSFSRVRRTPVLVSAGCGVLLFAAIVLLQRSGKNPFGLYPDSYSFENASYFQGTVGNVDMCSGYLTVVCGLFLSAVIETLRSLFHPAVPSRAGRSSADTPAEAPQKAPPEKHAPKILSRILLLIFLLLILSLSGWLLVTMDVDSGLVALAALLLWTLIRFLPKKLRLPALILLLAAVLLMVWYLPGESGPAYELREVLHGRPQIEFGSGRVWLWVRTLNMLFEDNHWLLGTGADTFALRFNTFLRRFEMEHPQAKTLSDYCDSPHCEYLAILVNCGIPALLCFLALVLAGCFGSPVWRDGVLGYSVQAFLSFSVCIVAPMFWVVLGLSLACPPEEIPRKT